MSGYDPNTGKRTVPVPRDENGVPTDPHIGSTSKAAHLRAQAEELNVRADAAERFAGSDDDDRLRTRVIFHPDEASVSIPAVPDEQYRVNQPEGDVTPGDSETSLLDKEPDEGAAKANTANADLLGVRDDFVGAEPDARETKAAPAKKAKAAK